MIFTGSMTAIVTPFTPDAKALDMEAFSLLVERQIAAGTDGIVVLGTTGESPTINHNEAGLLLKTAVQVANNRTRIVAGVSGNDTAKVLDEIVRAQAQGVDGIMVAAPYYNKPTQPGLFAHYGAIAQATDLPIMVYNIPGRTGVNIALDTLTTLHKDYPHICAVKEASGDYQQIADTIRAFRGRNFSVMSGDDSMVFPVMTLGGQGVVSVLSNLYPQIIKQLVSALAQNNIEAARALYDQYLPLMRGIFIGGNPGGIKTLMAQEKLLAASYRLPLCPPSKEEVAQVLKINSDVVASGTIRQRAA